MLHATMSLSGWFWSIFWFFLFPACETAILHLGLGAPILRRTCPCLAALLCRFHPIHTRPRASLVSCPKSRGSYTYRTELVTRRSCFADASMASIVQSADIPVSFLSVRALDPCMALVTDERSRSRVSCSNLTIMVAWMENFKKKLRFRHSYII